MHVYCSRARSVVFQELQKVLHVIEVAVVQFAQVRLVIINPLKNLHTSPARFRLWICYWTIDSVG